MDSVSIRKWRRLEASRSSRSMTPSSPARSTRPPVAGTSPAMQRRTVDFPEPDSPMTPSASPEATVKPTSRQANVEPNHLVRPSTWSAQSDISLLPSRAAVGVATDPAVVARHLNQVRLGLPTQQAVRPRGPLHLECDIVKCQRLDPRVGGHGVDALLPAGAKERQKGRPVEAGHVPARN